MSAPERRWSIVLVGGKEDGREIEFPGAAMPPAIYVPDNDGPLTNFAPATGSHEIVLDAPYRVLGYFADGTMAPGGRLRYRLGLVGPG